MAKDQYVEEVTATKKQHWVEWLEDIEAPKDGSKTHIPTLNVTNPDGTLSKAIMNSEKSKILAKSFFPLPPTNNSIPQNAIYPNPVEHMPPFSMDQIKHAINKLHGYKAPGPNGICNIVFKECSDILTPYLQHLFNAVISHHTYYQPWRKFTMVVLCKPGKPNYSVPKAY
ncbi:hypothetical protein BDR04DRAFT_1151238 [Suillus decipiens]|nr:hypothetical protein BDR04DRAFT_1151238 [Suillus decipiens]